MSFIKWDEQWAEVFVVLFLVIGFIISVLLQNAGLTYLTILITGGLAGRIYYLKKNTQPIFPFILIILGFLFGYTLGNFWANRLWGVLVFIVGFWTSLQLHRKEIIGTFKSKLFIK